MTKLTMPTTEYFNNSPLTQAQWQALSPVWGTIREAARFGDINWGAMGRQNPLTGEALRVVGDNWGSIRSAARLGDINWAASTGFSPANASRGDTLFNESEWQQSGGNYVNTVTGQRATGQQIQALRNASTRLSANPSEWRGGSGSWFDSDMYNWEDSGLGSQWSGRGGEIANLPINQQREILEKLVFTDATSHGGWAGMSDAQRALVLGGAVTGGMALANVGPFAGSSAATAAGSTAGSGVLAPAASFAPGGMSAYTPAALSSTAAGYGSLPASALPGLGGGALSYAGSGVGAATTAASTALGASSNAGNSMAVPSWLTPAIQTGASLLGASIQSDAASDAVNAQAQANQAGLDYLRETRDMAFDLAEPYRQASLGAIDQMQSMTQPGYDVTTDPGYQFRVDEGMRALETSAAAKGNLGSGGFARTALDYAQGLASQEYNNIYNRLATIAGYDQVNNMTGTALNFGSNAAALSTNTGMARGYGDIAQGNAWSNALDQIMQIDWSQLNGD